MLIPPPESFEIPSGSRSNLWILAVLFVVTVFFALFLDTLTPMLSQPKLLTDPFLQLPTQNSVRVVWFTEFAGSEHTVAYGPDLKQIVGATTSKLSHTREDQNSRVGEQIENGTIFKKPTNRDIWRHEAEITYLVPRTRVPYRVISVREDGEMVSSDVFTLAPAPPPTPPTPPRRSPSKVQEKRGGVPLKILLTSDHQLMPMTAANLQKVAETIGKVDAVFFAGDLINVPDRASEWFDDNRGGAFFPCLQGRANYELEKNGVKKVYTGGQLIQHAPLFPAKGNHELMGRFSMETSLNYQLSDSFPRAVAEELYKEKAKELNPSDSPVVRDVWLTNNSFNADTYDEIFSFPRSNEVPQPNYYAVSFGDVRLVVLYITNAWRSPSLDPTIRGRYRERAVDLSYPENWGYGQHIFEPIVKGSKQYKWLQQELKSKEFKQARYKIVMFHHPPHTLGENVVPAFTDPVRRLDVDAIGRITVRYEYPKNKDYIIRDVVPLLESAGVQLVFYGHSHLWNRFVSKRGMHFLESSNVGNSYGAHWGDNKRRVPTGYKEVYVATGDPNGLEPVTPNIAPLLDENGKPVPYIASNDITVFSIFDTGTGTVSSYRFDTREPGSNVLKFDEFKLK